MIKIGMKKDFFSWIEKVIISLAVVGLIFWINRFLPTKALTKRLYPTHCFGEWFGIEKVLGQPDVSEKGEAIEFNSENSAFYQTGFKTLVCQGFEKMEGKFISAKLGVSLAITEISNEPEKSNKEIEEQPVEKEEPEKNEEEPKEELESFLKILPVFAQESEETTSTPEIVSSPDVIFNLRYFLDEKPYDLSTFSSYPISNATNNGYFYFDLPEVKSFNDLEKLKISFEGLLEGEPHLTVYLDSVWLEIEYEEKPSLKVFQEFDGNDWEIFAEFEDKRFQLTDNDFDDKFPSTDGESIVWQSQINSRWQIFYLNFNDFLAGKKEITQITQTECNNISPKVFERKIVWQAWLDNNWEIMVAKKDENGNWKIERITNDQNHDFSPDFSQGAIIWKKKIDQQTKKFEAREFKNQWQISPKDEK